MLFKHKVHVLYRKEELDHERLEGKVAIVLDVLFATSTIITALANGATEVIPTLDEAGARAGRYGFAHALYQQVLYDRVPPARRRQLHVTDPRQQIELAAPCVEARDRVLKRFLLVVLEA